MRKAILALLAAVVLAGCNNPVAQQAAVETLHDPVRSDAVVAVDFQPGTGRLDGAQLGQLNTMVQGRAQRDEFVVVTDGSGGPIQQARAQQISRSLSNAGARWVSTTVDPTMAMGPNQVVVIRSAYRIAERNCPNYNPASYSDQNMAATGGFGCSDAYNFGQMLARPRDAAVGRPMGPADATVNAAAIQRYRDGRVRTATGTSGGGTTTAGMSGVGEGGGMVGGAGGTGGSTGGSTPGY